MSEDQQSVSWNHESLQAFMLIHPVVISVWNQSGELMGRIEHNENNFHKLYLQ